MNRLALFVASLALSLVAVVLVASEAQGETRAEKLQREAIARGKALFERQWSDGGKTCATCHAQGRNKMKSSRAIAYPKYDRAIDKVVSIQQKVNQMIEKNSGGAALELGSDDLTALEAYLKTLN